MNDDGQGNVPPNKAASSGDTDPAATAAELRQLVQDTLAGDDEAYAEIFKRFRDKIYRISFRFTHDHDDAMDLTQTVFIKVHRSLDSYREEASFATWISRVATNCGIDLVRSRKREAKVNLEQTAELTDSALPDAGLGGPKLGPARELDNAELGAAIAEAVDALSEKHRSVFTLHCVDGMPYKEIAATLDISIGTVMSRLFHARRYLRTSLSPYLGETRLRTLLHSSNSDEEAS